jgi:hypothetical protein
LERESSLTKAEPAIASQDLALREEVKKRGHEVKRVVVAAGYSGSLPPTERPNFEEILDAAEKNEFDYVLATEIARLNRGEAYSYYYLKHQLEEVGVRLEFLDQEFHDDGESEIGALLEGLSVLLPSIDKRTLIRRFKRGKARVSKEGFQWTGVAPFGYTYQKGGQKEHVWSINDDEKEWVIKIFTWAAAGVSRRAIARRLNEAGVPTRKGAPWWAATVSFIIRNPRYKGEWPERRFTTTKARRPYRARPYAAGARHQHKQCLRVRTGHALRPTGEWGTVFYRPDLRIVDADLWERANMMGSQNKQASARRTKEPALLKGIIYCEHEHDGRPPRSMYYRTYKKQRPRYLCCYRRHDTGRHCNESLPAGPLEEAVWTLVLDMASDPERLLCNHLARAEETLARVKRVRATQAEAQAAVERAAAGQANLDAMLAMGEIDAQRHARASALITRKQEEAQRALDELLNEPSWQEQLREAQLAHLVLQRADEAEGEGRSVRDVVRRLLGNADRAALEKLEGEEKRARIRSVIKRVLYGPEGVFAEVVLAVGRVRIMDGSPTASWPDW